MTQLLRGKLLAAFSLFLLIGCSTPERNASTPEGAFAIAQEFESSDRFEEAIRRYNEVRNKFPYSNFAVKATLAVADVYFKQESYGEAQIAYQSFKELHPRHPQIDYVQFRIGLSLYNQLPPTIDRDLTLAKDTILAFSDLIKIYPKSTHVTEALDYRNKTIKMLAEKEEYIADFYFIRKNYVSALPRYENLYAEYGGLGYEKKALARMVISAHKAGETEKFEKYSKILFSGKFADSAEAAEARKAVK